MKKYILSFIIIFFAYAKGYSFDLKTHLWIAQQVLNDVVKNKAISINNKTYKLNDKVLSALITNPSHFRMGTLGIDVFPDPIVGQITAHPGLKGGWKTDDWIQHVLNSVSTPPEIAFAYGYACHASMDIFAHTYVNAYSGDIFQLSDEIAVERRHFALEKYIGNHIPALISENGQVITDYASLVSSPAGFLSKTFILNNAVQREYKASGSYHLVAMNGVYHIVNELDRANQNAISTLSTNYLNLLKEESRLLLELDKKVGLTGQAGLQLKLTKEALDLKTEANKVLLEKIKLEKELFDKGLEAQKNLENIIQQKHKIISDGNALVSNLENEAINKKADIAKVAVDISLLPLTISQEITKEISKWIPGVPYPCGTWSNPLKMCSTSQLVKELIKETIQITNPAIDQLKNQKNKLIDEIANIEKTIVNTKSDMITAANDIAQKTEELNNLKNNLVLSEANQLKYKVEKEALDKETELSQAAYNKAEEIYEKAKKEESDAKGRLENFVDQFINVAKDLIDRYNLVHLILDNWRKDIEKASVEYIYAGEKFSKDILSKNGNGFSHYVDWYKCWSPVFVSVPSQIPQAACTIENYYQKLNTEIDKILEKLGPLQYLLNPTKIIKEKVENEAKKAIEYASIHISNHLFGKETTDFFLMISGREEVTTAKLIEIFKEDGSGKNLLTFQDITAVINKEMGITDHQTMIDPEKFSSLFNAIQLSKLSVLNERSLNKLHSDYLGGKKTAYGKTLYPDLDNSNFTILNKAVNSIDGSCQWMHTSTPLYRHSGVDQKWPNDRNYGYAHCSDNSYGFRLWVDEPSREKIFNIIFKGPLTPELHTFASYNNDNKRFTPCIENPFPSTMNSNCKIVGKSPDCDENSLQKFFGKLFD
ncbi:hypothetical protein [Chryseobacterium herbae]|uniref:Zinc dependent phospholipase C n=1 Tax=Chryseobacterium herbae TaxID=2976476 RepID=A0ABT2ISX3_9FLAO|nr:hypothetical protein [Chryseobacterium sp. pc1-10]MCT2561887.1 hypothetical protein [Chryseobacterium sp. pc1-10]